MKKISNQLMAAYSNYIIDNTIMDNFSNAISSYNSYTYSVSVDNDSLIKNLERNIIFKNNLIVDSLIKNKELLDCLTDTLKLISDNGLSFHADLDLISEDESKEPKFLLVYYPIILNQGTNISVQRELSDTSFNYLYRSVIRNLFKYSISIRKSVVIDEQII